MADKDQSSGGGAKGHADPKPSDQAQPGIAWRVPLAAIAETIPDAMIVIDEAGHIESFSKCAEGMFGYGEAEVLGENVSMLMPSPHRERHDEYILRYLTTSEKRIIGIGRATRARHRNGKTFPIDLHIGEAVIEQRRFFVGFIQDLSRQHQNERQLHSLLRDLARADRISRTGTIASAIAHELNQPLAAISNYVEAAALLAGEQDKDSGTLNEALAHCADEVERAGAIIRRIRDFVSHGDSEATRQSLSGLVEEAVALALADGDGADVAVSTGIDDDANWLMVDRIQVQQCLVNLIRNALQAMEAMGDKRIHIAARALTDEQIEVTVADSGTGIDPAIADRLFQPFLTTKRSGMGLGLSVCHRIVDAHGGRIWTSPAPGGGTIFHLTLPTAPSEAAAS